MQIVSRPDSHKSLSEQFLLPSIVLTYIRTLLSYTRERTSSFRHREYPCYKQGRPSGTSLLPNVVEVHVRERAFALSHLPSPTSSHLLSLSLLSLFLFYTLFSSISLAWSNVPYRLVAINHATVSNHHSQLGQPSRSRDVLRLWNLPRRLGQLAQIAERRN